jgi:hypothetical protein
MRRTLPLLLVAAGLAAAVSAAPAALADESPVKIDWAAHPGAGVAAVAGMVLLFLLAFAGLGCAVSLLSVVFPSLSNAVDRHARTSSPAWSTLVGVLVALGVGLAAAGAHRTGWHALGGAVGIALVLPALLLAIAGLLATIPLLGERVLGRRGEDASPLLRAVTGSVVLALAAGAGAAFHPLGILVAAAMLGWPLGVGVGALVRRIRRPPPAPSA